MIYISKNTGKIFEDEIKDSINHKEIYYERIKDPAASFGGDSAKTRFSTHNPYDTYAYKYPNFFALELKSTKTKSLSFSTNDNKSQIKKCQIDGLTRASEFKGTIAGFLFNFREQSETYFLNIKDFNVFVDSTDKKSINVSDVSKYGGIIIPQKLKVVKYTYDLSIIFNMIGD